jgi:hypothetical protein
MTALTTSPAVRGTGIRHRFGAYSTTWGTTSSVPRP